MLGEMLRTSSVGLGVYPVVSLIIFFTVFVAATWRMLKVDKKYCEEMSAMPLDKNNAVNRDQED